MLEVCHLLEYLNVLAHNNVFALEDMSKVLQCLDYQISIGESGMGYVFVF